MEFEHENSCMNFTRSFSFVILSSLNGELEWSLQLINLMRRTASFLREDQGRKSSRISIAPSFDSMDQKCVNEGTIEITKDVSVNVVADL